VSDFDSIGFGSGGVPVGGGSSKGRKIINDVVLHERQYHENVVMRRMSFGL
jgi:hypothetical protein